MYPSLNYYKSIFIAPQILWASSHLVNPTLPLTTTDGLTGGTGGEQDGADSGHQEESLLLLRRGCWKLLLWTRPPNEASPNPHDSQFAP